MNPTNRSLATLCATLLISPLFAVSEQPPEMEEEEEEEEESALSIELTMDVLSDYVWRGIINNDNPVWQPSVTIGYDMGDYGSLSANIWSTFSLTDKRSTGMKSRRAAGCQEIDYTISYAVDLAGFGLEIGHIWYTYPSNDGPSDQDVYASISYENPILTPSASVYWNYSDSAGNDDSCLYYNVAVAHEFGITDALTFTPSASLGFGGNAWSKYAADESTGMELSDQTTQLALSYAVTDNFSLGAHIDYTWIPSKTLRHADYMGRGKDQLLWGGISATLTF